MRNIFNRGDRREVNKRKFHNKVKQWFNQDSSFWGRIVRGGKRYAETWVELMEHGDGIWALKKGKGANHKADEWNKRSKKELKKQLRKEDKQIEIEE